MKQIKSEGVFEKKIRIYQPFRVEELNDFYQKHKKEYKNINQLFVSLIFSGLEKEKLMDENASQYYYQSQDIAEGLADVAENVVNIKLNMAEVYKGLMNMLYQNQLLLFRLYNGMFDLSQGRVLNKELYDNGIKDWEPNNFDENKQSIKEKVDVMFGIFPKI